MDFTPLNVTIAILGISLLVVVHEAGHYLAARAFGMRVLRFSIGLGPAIWKYQPKDSPTVFQICAMPLLAYVQIDGMNPADEIDPKDPTLYPNKGVFARIVTIFAGPLANYLAASVMIFTMAQVGGLPTPHGTNVVEQVLKGTAAQLAKLRPGDRIVEVEGASVEDRDALVAANADRADQDTRYLIERDGERLELVLVPRLDDGAVILGIRTETETTYRTLPMQEAASVAVEWPIVFTGAQLEGIGKLFAKLAAGDREAANNVQSVVGMTNILADSMETSPQVFLFLLIQISIALGLFNLLPFPALDGGRLTFLAYELITRRRANERVEAAIHTVGLLFLLGVLVLVMAKDIFKLT